MSSPRRTRLFLYCLLFMATSVLLTGCMEEEEEEDGVSIADEELDSGNEHDVFVPTKEWQIVKEGQHIPPGLHVRMNLQTGLKEAKLLDENTDEAESGSDTVETAAAGGKGQRTQLYGSKSDRRGVVNKRTKVFSAGEVADMLEGINDDSVDLTNLPQIASSSSDLTFDHSASHEILKTEGDDDEEKRPLTSTKDLPVTLHGDVKSMLSLAKVLSNRSASVQELCQALEGLEDHVHQIDNARDLNGIGGLVLVVRLLNHTHPEVKSWAARVIGSASQSNPPVQKLALQYGSLPLLCSMLSLSEPELVQRRALFAISALLRGNSKEQLSFIKTHQGVRVLGESFDERSPQVRLKAAVLLTDLLNDELGSGEAGDHPLELPVLVYNEVLSSGWCKNIPTLIHSHQVATIEKGLLAMRALSSTCQFSSHTARLRELVKWLEDRGQRGQDLDAEYTGHLVEQCRELLRQIHTQKLDL